MMVKPTANLTKNWAKRHGIPLPNMIKSTDVPNFVRILCYVSRNKKYIITIDISDIDVERPDRGKGKVNPI